MQASVLQASALRLLHDATEVRRSFEQALAWCEELVFTTPAIDSQRGSFADWALLLEHGHKIRHAYVALDGLLTEPAALDHLHALGSLRLVPAADGSFRSHLFGFRRGELVRVLLGSGRLCPSGSMAPLEAVVDWAGTAVCAFALETESLLEKARRAAHVPDPGELEAYTKAYFEAADLWDHLVELGAPFIRGTAADAELPELEVVADARSIREAMRTMREQVLAAATWSGAQTVGFHGGSITAKLHWNAPLKLWAMFGERDAHYWNAFGVMRPDPEKALQITVSVNAPLEGIDRKSGGAFARDPAMGDVYLVHRGRIGGGQKGIGAELFWRRFRGGVEAVEAGKEGRSRVVVVGKVGGAGFLRDLAAFVHEVGRIKRAAG